MSCEFILSFYSPVDGDGDHVHEGGCDVAVEEEWEQPGKWEIHELDLRRKNISKIKIPGLNFFGPSLT